MAQPQGRGETVTEAQEAQAQRTDPVKIAAQKELERLRAQGRDPGQSLALASDQQFVTPFQLAALRQLGLQQAGSADIAVYLHVCQQTQLDPFSRQIHMIMRMAWNPDTRRKEPRWTIQTGISGYQVIRDRAARRDGNTVGYDDTIWYDSDGNEYKVWLKRDQNPYACRVVVRKDGLPFPGVVYWHEIAALDADGKPQAEWKHQGAHMIEKCAESFALRRAFPNDLSGIFTDEEMSGWDARHREPPRPGRPGKAETATEPQDDAAVTGQVVTGPGEPAARERPRSNTYRDMGHARDHMFGLLDKLGITGKDEDRGARLAILAFIRSGEALDGSRPENIPPLATARDLTRDQLDTVIRQLEQILEVFDASDADAGERRREMLKLAAAAGWREPETVPQ